MLNIFKQNASKIDKKKNKITPRKSFGNVKNSTIDMNKFTLGTFVGITQGSINQNQMKIPESKSKLLSLAACYIAFGMTYFEEPDNWTTAEINDILSLAEKLVNNSEENYCIDVNYGKLSEDNLLQSFNMFDNMVEIFLTDPQIIGNINPDNSDSKNIYNGLCSVFHSNKKKRKQAYIFRCNQICLLIWQCLSMYFVFDSNGRTKHCISDLENGLSSLICIYSLKSVAHLIYSLSGLPNDEFYSLTEIKLKSCIKINNNINKADVITSEWVQNKLIIVSDQVALIRGTISISNDCFTISKLDQAVIVCCVAYVYSKIHETISWNSRIIDKCILLGYEIYKDLVDLNSTKRFTIDDLPTQVNLGPYMAKISTNSDQQYGQIKLANPNINSTINQTDLMIELKKFFNEKSCGILQIDKNLYFIIWHQNQFYYLFDPYERDDYGNFIVSTHENISNSTTKPTAACLQLHCTLTSLCLKLILNLTSVKDSVEFELFELVADIKKIGQRQNYAKDEDNKMDNYINNESIDSIYLSEMEYFPMKHRLDSTSDENGFLHKWVSTKVDGIYNFQQEEKEPDYSDSSFEISDEDDTETETEEKLPNPSKELISTSNTDNLNISESLILKWKAVDDIISIKNIEQLQKLNITIEEYEQLLQLGFNFNEILQIKEYKIDPKLFHILKNRTIKSDMSIIEFLQEYQQIGLNLNETTKLINASVTADQLEQCKQLGIDIEDILLVLKYNGNLNDYINERKLGGVVDNLEILSRINEKNLTTEEGLIKDEGIFDEVKEEEEYSGNVIKSSSDIEIKNEAEPEIKEKTVFIDDLETLHPKLNDDVKEEIPQIKDDNNDECLYLNRINPEESENFKSDSNISIPNKFEEYVNQAEPIISNSNENRILQSFVRDSLRKKSASVFTLNSQCDSDCNSTKKHDLAVIQSKNGSQNSYIKLLKQAFMLTDRVLILNSAEEPDSVAFMKMKPQNDTATTSNTQPQYYLDEKCSFTINMIRRINIDKVILYLTKYDTIISLARRICHRLSPQINKQIESTQEELPELPNNAAAAVDNNGLPTNQFIRGIIKDGLVGVNAELNDLLENIKSLKQ